MGNPPYSALLLTLHSCTVPPACILKVLPRAATRPHHTTPTLQDILRTASRTSTVDTKDRQLLLKVPSKAKAQALKELLSRRPTLPRVRSLRAILTLPEDLRLLTRTRGLILKELPCLCRLEVLMFRLTSTMEDSIRRDRRI